MCLAAPAKILEIFDEGNRAWADYGGIKKKIVISLIENAQVGDYVIIHAGYAIEKLDEKQALENLETWSEFLETVK
ncbi:MAG: HypC/HybG/HupF family hydrogenase formation chaperone [Candidatus Helarchaeota archaeon]